MLVAKQVADGVTWLRAAMAIILVWLGTSQGEGALPAAIWLLIASWTSDTLDGPLARSSRVQYRSWIGDHDLQVDKVIRGGSWFTTDIAVRVSFRSYIGIDGYANHLGFRCVSSP